MEIYINGNRIGDAITSDVLKNILSVERETVLELMRNFKEPQIIYSYVDNVNISTFEIIRNNAIHLSILS
ncbi:MAG: hypothetical protein QXN68_03975 [Thermoplasmata archaeon]